MGYIKNCRVAQINIATAGNTTIIPANALGPGLGTFKVWQLLFNGEGANVVTFYSGTTPLSPIIFTNTGASSLLQNTEEPWFQAQPGQALIINTSTANPVIGEISYTLA